MLGLLLDLPSLSFLIISKSPPTSTSISLGTAGTHFFCLFLFHLYVSKNIYFFHFVLLFSPPSLRPFLLTCLFCFSWPGFLKWRQWHCFTVLYKFLPCFGTSIFMFASSLVHTAERLCAQTQLLISNGLERALAVSFHGKGGYGNPQPPKQILPCVETSTEVVQF